MNYYSHNIGDYAQATTHLSLIEDAIYSRLLRRYYAEEAPIADDMAQVCRWVGARSEDEKAAVSVVLEEFFTLDGDAWRNKRADQEIAAYQHKAETNRVNGKSGGRPPKKPKLTQSVNSGLANETQEEPSRNPNQEPITNNQETTDQEHAAAAAPATTAELPAEPEPVQPKAKRGTRLPADWTLPAEWLAWAVSDRAEFTPQAITLEGHKFADFWKAKAGKDATKLDWMATWRNWFRNARVPSNVRQFPAQSRHTGFDSRDYTAGLTEREDGTYAF